MADGNRYGLVQLKLISSAGVDEEMTDLVRKVFSNYSSTDGIMDQAGFGEFLHEYAGLISDIERADQYFRAFDDTYQSYILFNQFLTGLAALDPGADHGRELGEIRCRYIFRFYCKQQSGRAVMDRDDFKNLVQDIVVFRDPSLAGNASEIRKKGLPYFQHFETEMNLQKFLSKVGSLQLRGTSGLFRARRRVVEILREKALLNEVVPMDITGNEAGGGDVSQAETSVQTGTDFRISRHVVHITSAGCVMEKIHEMGDLSINGELSTTAVTQSTRTVLQQQPSFTNGTQEKATNCAVDILKGLDYFYRPYAIKRKPNVVNGDDSASVNQSASEQQRKPPLDWFDVKKSKLASCIIKLCKFVRPVLRSESRCLTLKQPIYVLGDLHGNYEDLHEFERLFWPLGPEFSASDVLFLGDYVDRGKHGVEVVAYLFALKLLAPKKIFLLRGNHEFKEQQAAFSFKTECTEKFGPEIGDAVWNAINSCFDCMPVAAVIDRKLFCVHGGIPHVQLLSEIPGVEQNDMVGIINNLCPCPAQEFGTSSVPWELLWNDPVWDDNQSDRFDDDGFRLNTKRKTGHEFNETALDTFLKRFGFTHLIRAHQVHAAGFQVRYKAKCITVFSSSMYSGLVNEAAVVMIHNDEIKVIRLSMQSDQLEKIDKENVRKRDVDPFCRNVGAFAKR